MSTQPAEPMNGKMSDLRFIDGGLKRARFADKTATFFFYFISAAFVFLLIAFTLYVVWGGIKAFKPEVFSFGPQGIGSQFFGIPGSSFPSDFSSHWRHGRCLHGGICHSRQGDQYASHCH